MVQTMETWIVADATSLVRYYGQGFNRNALPRALNLETVDKAAVENALNQATRNTQKGIYHKIRHASEILGMLQSEEVRKRCPGCERLFYALKCAITGTRRRRSRTAPQGRSRAR
jgi:hypothetical protein